MLIVCTLNVNKTVNYKKIKHFWGYRKIINEGLV